MYWVGATPVMLLLSHSLVLLNEAVHGVNSLDCSARTADHDVACVRAGARECWRSRASARKETESAYRPHRAAASGADSVVRVLSGWVSAPAC